MVQPQVLGYLHSRIVQATVIFYIHVEAKVAFRISRTGVNDIGSVHAKSVSVSLTQFTNLSTTADAPE
jgi:type IV secretory pathway ATPase VirB11/archaellum biosynthesis ATPase